MKFTVDYDKIASGYEQRYINNHHESTLKAIRSILSKENPLKVLEVGCGTSYWLKALSQQISASLIGLDSSIEMLKMGKGQKGIHLFQSYAESISLKTKSTDFIFCVNALHHFKDKLAFIHEAHRVLGSKRKLAIIGMDPRDTRNKWYIYRFFVGTYEFDLERFPSWSQVESWLGKVGFRNIDLIDVEWIHDPKKGKDVLKDPFLKKNACSQLTLLSQKAYQQGLNRLKDAIIKSEGTNQIFENDIILSMMIAEKR